MNENKLDFILRCCLALFISMQVWVWVRYFGAFLVSDSLDLVASLFKSVSPFSTALEGFLVFLLPVLLASLIFKGQMRAKRLIYISMFVGATFSCLYLFNMALPDIAFLKTQVWVYVAAGSSSGLVYGCLLGSVWRTNPSDRDDSVYSRTRRNLLGSVGLLAGGTSLVASGIGPFYLWRNRNTFVDVSLGHLKSGQLTATEIADKPVWVIKRSPEQIAQLGQNNQQLADPHSDYSQQPGEAKNSLRSLRPEYFVVVGLCTHLGCMPTYTQGGEGYRSSEPHLYCPCHGGVFDLAGRVFAGTPPPENMIVPKHEYVSEDIVRVYFPTLEEGWRG